AEDGIRDDLVTGVQTCALPIFRHADLESLHVLGAVQRLVGGGLAVAVVGDRNDGVAAGGLLVARRERTEERRLGVFLPVVEVAEIGRASCRERGSVVVGAGGCT